MSYFSSSYEGKHDRNIENMAAWTTAIAHSILFVESLCKRGSDIVPGKIRAIFFLEDIFIKDILLAITLFKSNMADMTGGSGLAPGTSEEPQHCKEIFWNPLN